MGKLEQSTSAAIPEAQHRLHDARRGAHYSRNRFADNVSNVSVALVQNHVAAEASNLSVEGLETLV